MILQSAKAYKSHASLEDITLANHLLIFSLCSELFFFFLLRELCCSSYLFRAQCICVLDADEGFNVFRILLSMNNQIADL